MEQLLQAEGLPTALAVLLGPLQGYIDSGIGTQAELLAAARARHARDQRRDALNAALAAEGINTHFSFSVPEAAAFVASGEGGQEAALAACRARHAQQQERQARLATLQALLPQGADYYTCEPLTPGSPPCTVPSHALCRVLKTCLLFDQCASFQPCLLTSHACRLLPRA